ncbi:hypothetical protein [Novosphingobium sp. KACC 22771]|uniref:hypothetical protein n=1 Tax=Novosphingobium sp. KACC 22771 TaxID=3025670 RepID=UPI0023657FEB|nr:hypothetical protein [Novosphingobium sp. KACC 22771]WDF71940.1 hypothetical protein PQ467_14220 [Novosphingobium sp. KACC 22771]
MPFALGAAAAHAQSVDVFGAAPAPSPAAGASSSAPAAGAPAPSAAQSPAPRIPVAKDLIGKSPIAWSPSPRPTPKGSVAPRTPAPPQRQENAPAETLRPRVAQAAPRAASSQPAPIKPAIATSAPPQAVPAPVATPSPPVAASARPAPVAAPPAPVHSRVEEVLFPLGIGFGLAGELALLWFFLRWRARRAKRAKAEAPPRRRPATPAAEPPPADSAADGTTDVSADSGNVAGDEEHAAIIARLFDQAQQAEPPNEPVAPHPRRPAPAPAFVASFADGADDADPPIVTPPAMEIARRSAPEPIPAARQEPEAAPSTRGVFKPSPLFNRMTPAETVKQVPLAPPDPLSIGFEALRLSTSASRIELRFRVTLRNDGPAPLGPIRVDSCMSAPEGDLPDTALAHSLAMLMPGEEVAIAEEWRVPLIRLPVLRLGAMRLLVGAARIFATVEGAAAYPFQDRTFMFGLPEDGGRLGPIPLDGGAHLYDNLLVQSVAPERG